MRLLLAVACVFLLPSCAKSFDDEYAETENKISEDAKAFDAEMNNAATKQENSK